jgi:hypothetical protein
VLASFIHHRSSPLTHPFHVILTAVIAVSLLVYLGMRDTKRYFTIGR